MKNISLSLVLLTGFMVIGAEKTNVNVLNQLKKLGKRAQDNEQAYRGRISDLFKVLKPKREKFLLKKEECSAQGYRDNLCNCPQFEDIRNAYIESPEYKEQEELRIQQYSDLYDRDVVRLILDRYHETGQLEVDNIRNQLNNSYSKVRDIETEEGKAKLAEAMKATHTKVANIIDVEKQQ